MNRNDTQKAIESGKAVLGIEYQKWKRGARSALTTEGR